ncbi:MAG: YfcC family protein [Acidobacteria bacterium]|nr:YfcC family protein [Acidobacteriota bacterium]
MHRPRLPHPLLLLLLGVVAAAALTWILPSGAFDRRNDPLTGRRVLVAGTYHPVARAPVGPLAAAIAVPRGFVAGADVIAVVLFVGGAWVVVDRLGALPALVAMLVGRFRRRGLWAIPVICVFFAVMGALENMQEEIIPLVPVLLVLGQGLGVEAVVVVAMSAGAAMIGSAFGPTNPFQAGIALKLAQLSPVAGGRLRLAMFIVGLALWIAWTIRYAIRNRVSPTAASAARESGLPIKHALILAIAIAPMAAYVYGALRLDWGFNELAGAFLVAGLAAGLIGGLGPTGTLTAYLEGAQSLLPAALMIGAARGISLVLEDGRVVDTILHGLVTPLSRMSPRGRRAAPDSRAGTRTRRGAERQRSSGPDDAARRAAGGSAGCVSAGACTGISDGRRAHRTRHADQRGADGGAARGGRAIPEVDSLRRRRSSAGHAARDRQHRRGDVVVAGLSDQPSA